MVGGLCITAPWLRPKYPTSSDKKRILSPRGILLLWPANRRKCLKLTLLKAESIFTYIDCGRGSISNWPKNKEFCIYATGLTIT